MHHVVVDESVEVEGEVGLEGTEKNDELGLVESNEMPKLGISDCGKLKTPSAYGGGMG